MKRTPASSPAFSSSLLTPHMTEDLAVPSTAERKWLATATSPPAAAAFASQVATRHAHSSLTARRERIGHAHDGHGAEGRLVVVTAHPDPPDTRRGNRKILSGRGEQEAPPVEVALPNRVSDLSSRLVECLDAPGRRRSVVLDARARHRERRHAAAREGRLGAVEAIGRTEAGAEKEEKAPRACG